MKTVLLDCDGVLADFVTPALEVVRQVTGISVKHDDVKTWEIMDSVPGITKEQIGECYEVMKDDGYCSAIPPYAGAYKGVTELRKHANIVIVTSPFKDAWTWMHEREHWLARYFNVERRDVIHASAKHLIIGDLFVDDKASHVLGWIAAQKRLAALLSITCARAVLWKQNYNLSTVMSEEERQLVEHTNSWERLIELVT